MTMLRAITASSAPVNRSIAPRTNSLKKTVTKARQPNTPTIDNILGALFSARYSGEGGAIMTARASMVVAMGLVWWVVSGAEPY